jgi:hypothetical protein
MLKQALIASALVFGTAGVADASLEQKLADTPYKNCRHDKYALLVRGYDDLKYAANLSIAYQSLLEQGYKPENVVVLAPTYYGETYFHPTDGDATKENIQKVCEYFAKKADCKDTLLVYMNDHGYATTEEGQMYYGDMNEEMYGFGPYPHGYEDTEENNEETERPELVSKFCLPGEDISELELEEYLSGLQCAGTLYFFDFCYAGGFADRMGSKPNSIAISTSPDHASSSSMVDNSMSGFFFKAFRPDSGADKNGDNFTSIQEAFDYAMAHWNWPENPQFVYTVSPQTISLKGYPYCQPTYYYKKPKGPLQKLFGL